MQQIEKLDTISYQQFIDNYLKPGIPVIFRQAAASWPAANQFNPDFFRQHFGDYRTTHGNKEYSMSDILTLTAQSTAENPAPYPILFEIPLQLPKLLPMIEPIHMGYAFPNWFRSSLIPYGKFGKSLHLFIGGTGNQYSLHKDMYHTNAWVTQLYGEKEFIVFPREQEELLYAGEAGFISPINILKPDYEKYPKYKNATPIRAVLQPGETIFIPNGIWHTTVAKGHNISLILDQLNSTNFRAWRKDAYDYSKNKNRLKALATYGLAHTLGSLCKLRELAGYKFQR